MVVSPLEPPVASEPPVSVPPASVAPVLVSPPADEPPEPPLGVPEFELPPPQPTATSKVAPVIAHAPSSKRMEPVSKVIRIACRRYADFARVTIPFSQSRHATFPNLADLHQRRA